MSDDIHISEVCIVALAEAFRGDGEVLCNPMGPVPVIAGRLARATFEPDLMLTDTIAYAVSDTLALGGDVSEATVESYMPFRSIFDQVWSGKRHVVMGAPQIDRFGNQNFACIGDYEKPKAQLLGMRGAPGNTLSHTTSYWIPNHSPKTFVEKVDVVSGVGYDRAKALGPATSRFHEIRRVVSNLGVFDFGTPDRSMRLVSVHPGTTVDEVVEQTGFPLAIDGDVPETRAPDAEELRIIREVLDPQEARNREVPV